MTQLWFSQVLLADGWAENVRLTIKNGKISRLETDVAPAPGDQCHKVGLPGLGNVHSHAFQRAMAGLAERHFEQKDSFWGWREIMYRFTRLLEPEDVRAIAALAYMEMLEAGFTHVGEFHYLHHDPEGKPYADIGEMAGQIIAAAQSAGIGLTLLPVFYAHSGFGGLPATEAQKRFVNSLDSFRLLHQRCCDLAKPYQDIVVGLAPHSLRAVSKEQIIDLMPLAKNRPVHIHISEQLKEVEDCLQFYTLRPVDWLFEHVDVTRNWCLVHATHMSEAELKQVAESKAVVGLCPITEANLGDGLFNLKPYIQQNGQFAIGTDSNVLISMTEELRLLEYGQRLHHQGRNIADTMGSTGQSLYSKALAGGGLALGCDYGIAQGHRADLISLNMEHPSLIGRQKEAVFDAFVFATAHRAVDRVWHDGIERVVQGHHRDRARITDEYAKVMARLCP